MKTLKKFLAILLSVTMVLGTITVVSLGETPEGTAVSTEKELYDAWKAGGTYYFANDITIGVASDAWKDKGKPTNAAKLVIDLNGYSLLGGTYNGRLCNTGAYAARTLTIKSSKDGGKNFRI